MRKDDCKALLEECSVLVSETDFQIKKNLDVLDKQEIYLPVTKSFFEHCRSVLDYIALDIYDSKNFPKGKVKENSVYFPYGKDPIKFNINAAKIFPHLKNHRADIYTLIEGLQDYKMGSNKFLVAMMDLTNENKHRNLTKHKRKDMMRLGLDGIIQTDETSHVIMSNCSVNGHPIKHLEFKDGEIYGTLCENLLPLIYKKNVGFYTFPNIDSEVISFMNLCRREIHQFYENFYDILA